MAAAAGITRAAVNFMLNGLRAPRMGTALRMANYLGVTVDALLHELKRTTALYEAEGQKIEALIRAERKKYENKAIVPHPILHKWVTAFTADLDDNQE